MKTFIATTGALALMATGAMAAPPAGKPANFNNTNGTGNGTAKTVILKAKVFEYIAVWGMQDSQQMNVDDVTVSSSGQVNNNKGADGNKAKFNVTSNVTHDVKIDWETWGDVSQGSTAEENEANFANSQDGCSIGGTVTLDPDLTTTGDDISGAGQSELTETGFDATWKHTFGIGTVVNPDITTCPNDIAAPGNYTLAVDITVSKN